MWSVDLVGFNQLKFILIAQNESLCFRALKTQAETQLLTDTSFVLRAVILPQTLQKAVVCFLGVLFGGHGHTVTFFQYVHHLPLPPCCFILSAHAINSSFSLASLIFPLLASHPLDVFN